MPLLRNTQQPYFPDPNSPNAIACAGEYCYLIQPPENLMTQFYQTPCGSNEVSDPNFADVTVGSELIALASGTADPVGSWLYDVFFVHWTFDAPNVVNSLSWTIALAAGTTYLLEFTVSGLQSGNFLDVFLGSTNQSFIVGQNGNVSVVIQAGSDNSDLVFSAVSINDIIVSDVSLKSYVFNDWDLNDNWTVNDGVACKTGTTTGALEETVADYILNGEYWVLTFTVSGRTIGSVTPYIANQAGLAITSNDSFTIYKTATADGVIKFVPSANFDGCISLIDARKMKNDYDVTLYLDGDSYDISAYLSYYNEFVTLIYNPEDDDLPYGCFTIEIIDSCTVQFDEIVTNGEFAGGAGSSCPDWFKNNDATMYDFDGSNCEFIRSDSAQTNSPFLRNTQNPNLVAGNYEVTFDIVSNSDLTGIGATIGLDGIYYGAYFSTVGTHTFVINGYDPESPSRPPNNLQRVIAIANFRIDGAPHLGSIIIDNVSVRRIAPFDATYTSECIHYKANHPNSKLIQGYSDQPAYGFEFENTGFKLQQRMVIKSYNESWDKTKLVSVSGSGNSRLNYAESTKFWQVTTDFLSESAHGALSAQLDMDHFLIGNNDTDFIEYTGQADSYNPDWRDGDYDLAPFTFQLRLKEKGTVFNRHLE